MKWIFCASICRWRMKKFLFAACLENKRQIRQRNWNSAGKCLVFVECYFWESFELFQIVHWNNVTRGKYLSSAVRSYVVAYSHKSLKNFIIQLSECKVCSSKRTWKASEMGNSSTFQIAFACNNLILTWQISLKSIIIPRTSGGSKFTCWSQGVQQ